MIRRTVVLSPEALEDLIALYARVAEAASSEIAGAYVGRIEAYLTRFDLASERGARRDDIRLGLRTIGFERRLTIAFAVDDRAVTILRVFSRGQDWQAAFV